MSTELGIEQLQAKAREVAAHAKMDQEFAHRLRAMPVATLREAGLPDIAIARIVEEDKQLEPEEELHADIDVEGYTVKCICTGCCITFL